MSSELVSVRIPVVEEETQQTDIAKTACGGKLKNTKNFPSAVYHGEQIYFCTKASLRVFYEDPDAFIAGEIEHPIHEDEE